jgi:hypothetical protein
MLVAPKGLGSSLFHRHLQSQASTQGLKPDSFATLIGAHWYKRCAVQFPRGAKSDPDTNLAPWSFDIEVASI